MLFVRKLRFGAGLFFLLSFGGLSAIETDEILWNQFFWQGPKEWQVRPYMEIQERLGQGMSKIEHLLFRPAVVWAPMPNMTVWAGYAWTPNFNVDTSTWTTEQRSWQQLAYTWKFGDRIVVMSRTRFEQRYIPNASDAGYRARELVRFHYAFDAAKIWQLCIWDEIFWQLNTVNAAVISGFNQNRIMIGPFIKAYENFFIEIGYLNIQTRQPDPKELKISHGIIFAAYTGL